MRTANFCNFPNFSGCVVSDRQLKPNFSAKIILINVIINLNVQADFRNLRALQSFKTYMLYQLKRKWLRQGRVLYAWQRGVRVVTQFQYFYELVLVFKMVQTHGANWPSTTQGSKLLSPSIVNHGHQRLWLIGVKWMIQIRRRNGERLHFPQWFILCVPDRIVWRKLKLKLNVCISPNDSFCVFQTE
jgi:hypothetical protein